MDGLSELDQAVDKVKRAGVPLVVFQCTSKYPTPPEALGLNLIPFLAQRYDAPVGLSDHSGTIYAGLAAMTLGISILEVHLTLSRDMFGPDVASSVTPSELRLLADGARFIDAARRNPVDKDVAAADLAPLRAMFTKSIVVRQALSKGTVLEQADDLLQLSDLEPV
jgi:N-acetylneuraminate synthase